MEMGSVVYIYISLHYSTIYYRDYICHVIIRFESILADEFRPYTKLKPKTMEILTLSVGYKLILN